MEINWDEIPKECNWVAQDWDGSVFAYNSAPRALSRCRTIPDWYNNAICISLGGGANPDWHNTKTRRPKSTAEI